MGFFLTIAGVCWLIGVYFNCKASWPIIEQDGDAWVIRVGNRFVDVEFMYTYPARFLRLVSGRDNLEYKCCKLYTKNGADLYFKHVCNFAAEGKFRKI